MEAPSKEGTPIGEVARRFGITLRTIRYYEELGLVSPKRTRKGTLRYFSTADQRILEIVLALRTLDFTLEQIQEMLGLRYDEAPQGRHLTLSLREILLEERRRVDQKLEQLRTLKERIESALKSSEQCVTCGRENCRSCPPLQRLKELGT